MQYCVDHPEEISKLAKVKAQVTEVKGVMMENIEKVVRLVNLYHLSSLDCLPRTINIVICSNCLNLKRLFIYLFLFFVAHLLSLLLNA